MAAELRWLRLGGGLCGQAGWLFSVGFVGGEAGWWQTKGLVVLGVRVGLLAWLSIYRSLGEENAG